MVVDIPTMIDVLLSGHADRCYNECCHRCFKDFELADRIRQLGDLTQLGTLRVLVEDHPRVLAMIPPQRTAVAA